MNFDIQNGRKIPNIQVKIISTNILTQTQKKKLQKCYDIQMGIVPFIQLNGFTK